MVIRRILSFVGFLFPVLVLLWVRNAIHMPFTADPQSFFLPLILMQGSPLPHQRLQPSDLTYLGAFRLPDEYPDEIGWMWSGEALAYYPDGDPSGPPDGFPGSLFGAGHNWNQYVSEISIPAPVNSISKTLDELNTAVTLQDFANIRGDLFGEMEIPRAGLAYLPAQSAQTGGKLYFAFAPHMGEGQTNPSHGWADLTLNDPHTAGAWRIGEYWNYVTGDNLLPIPSNWASLYTPGQLLATGRYRDGGQGAQGPSLFAIGPWNHGNPPAAGSTLSATPLLLYGDVTQPDPPSMDGYQHSDEWSGAAWLAAGDKAAVVFIGTKGIGDCWYGCADGTSEPPWPPDCNRGWWSTSFVGQIIFYDPVDLAAVALGTLETWEPQPYAILEIDAYLYHITSTQQWHHLGAASFDPQRRLLYIFEPLVDNDKPIVHVWQVGEP